MAAGGLAYFLILFDFSLNPLRTAVWQRYGSNFFDLQAEAFLHGHIAVPSGSLGIEGFVVHGKTYMYFPPFPALLRIPVMLVTHEFDGRLTLLSMALAWLVFAVMTAKLYWLVRRCLRADLPVSRLEALCSAIFLAAATGGTVLVFDASLPWVYHEVYLWATALAVGTLYWLVRVALRPDKASIWWLAGFAVATILTRTTSGWAMCAAVIATGIWLLTGRPHPGLRRVGWWVIAAGAGPLLIAASYNVVKFGHPYLFPLQDQVWTSVNARRRAALAHNGGTITGPQFFLTALVNYLRPDGIRLVGYFPYLTLPAHPAPAYGGAFLDQSYRTGSVPAFMPLLFLLSILGAVRTTRRRSPLPVQALRLPLLGALAITVGVMDYGYLTYRYTSEFVPFLVIGAAMGTCTLIGYLQPRGALVRRGAVAVVGVLAVFGALANMATGAALAAQTWQGDKLTGFVALQQHISAITGHPLDGEITRSTSVPMPGSGHTDELRVVGDCTGLYLNTGDAYQPWIVVQQRDRLASVQLPAAPVHDDVIPIFKVADRRRLTVGLQTRASGSARIVVTGADLPGAGPWFPVTPGKSVLMILRTHTDRNEMELYTSPGGTAGAIPLAEWGPDWISRINVLVPTAGSADAASGEGTDVRYGWGEVPALCRQLVGSGHG